MIEIGSTLQPFSLCDCRYFLKVIADLATPCMDFFHQSDVGSLESEKKARTYPMPAFKLPDFLRRRHIGIYVVSQNKVAGTNIQRTFSRQTKKVTNGQDLITFKKGYQQHALQFIQAGRHQEIIE
ncbi:hypothetical protein Pnap_3127 [Polaromonas naphthalenivorans CJ2]|uniref:Uncharacterized protein n=1 Tax=Polaromonas naphthalenivorans (strain CJ2) TaxID=365044 RepID=A1VRZ7_POLNA|nr:hypothetical protein Pnap_3127 [Polaromonas naphthalenivorans CJ2]